MKKNQLKGLLLGMLFTFFISSQAQVKVGDNPTTINPSALLEMESTNKGLLMSRITSAQRNAISTPANGLLIWNTTNNTFEVYKSNCVCWVTVADGGSTPAQSVVNTAPSATSLNYTGIGAFIQGEPATINYTYSDAQGDVEGITSFQWQIASSIAGGDITNIVGATSASYTPTLSNVGFWVRAVVTPRAATGVKNGINTFGFWTLIEPSTIPKATSLSVTGTTEQGKTLSASYTFAGGSGTENTDPLNGTLFLWQSAATNTGVGIVGASLYSNPSFTSSYIPEVDLLGRYVRVGVRAKDNVSLQAVNFVYSPWVGPITASAEAAPTASNIVISPTPAVNFLLSGSYTYNDVNYDPEGVSTFQWYRATDATGTGQTAIFGATNTTYTAVTADATNFLGFGVTPLALTGTQTGTQVITYNTNAVASAATFTFTATAIRQLPFFAINRLMNQQNAIQVEINVTSPGAVILSTNTVNGYSFSAQQVINASGIQWVTLTATGLQSAYNSAGDAFTLTGTGTTSNTRTFTINNNQTGAAFTTYANLVTPTAETFNNNGFCANSIISAGYTSTNCTGNFTVGSNNYMQVLINGQCWMRTSLIEVSTTPCAAGINSGCNVWTNTAQNDLGLWGYYNTTITSGASGWSTTTPAADNGLLYQWSAAMNGSRLERAQGVCPTGWHIPSDCEWMYLEHGQGLSLANQILDATRQTTTEGAKLRNGGTNTSGFSAILAGLRLSSSGSFTNRGNLAYFWTSTESSATNARWRILNSANSGVQRATDTKAQAASVRCLKD